MGCYVIVTTRNILWMVLSVVATLAVLAGIMTPKWIIGYPRQYGRTIYQMKNTTNKLNKEDLFYLPSLGIYNRCTKITTAFGAAPIDRCFEYVDSFFDLPSNEWKACMVFLCLGVFLLSMVSIMSLVGFFMQSVGRKSIFSVGGVIQGFAMLFLVIGLVLYPAGWGSDRVKELCSSKESEKPGAFMMNKCSFGWAFYSTLGGTVLACVCSLLSAQAEKSTSSDKLCVVIPCVSILGDFERFFKQGEHQMKNRPELKHKE